jgi:hypothetical protein
MFDWKILAASFAALLVVSSVLIGGFGFTDILGTLSDWMGDSPLSGLVTSPVRSSKEVVVTFQVPSFEASLDSADFEVDDAEFRGFSGTVTANFTSDEIMLAQKDTGFTVLLPLTDITIDDVSMPRLSLEETSFSVVSKSLETSGQNVSLEVTGFSGTLTLTREHVLLDGNVTSVVGNSKDIV